MKKGTAPPKEYTGSCYIGVIGGETEFGECRDSIDNLMLRPGDGAPRFTRATKGYEARQSHFNNWIHHTGHPFMLLLDHDQTFPPDTLERLRSHKLPYVSGYYLRRIYDPIAPVWFKLGPRGKLPMEPWTDDPERGKLHELGASGWGCILVHREVALAVEELLKGEPWVIEDDMDVWPYDLDAILVALRGLRTLSNERPDPLTTWPAMQAHLEVLEREIRPIRGLKDTVGSDIRFPFFAREAGYILHGDPDVRCGHMLNYPLSPDDFGNVPPEIRAKLEQDCNAMIQGESRRVRTRLAQLRGKITK